ncbi:type VI secretion system tube protein TssD [Pseudomonas glycinae]|uniref:type VI secretion system tube protein TssD n=1 Tax=Pseudomonas glycinae TaxID=1785145 RepID=UPI001E2924B3|nr:type VI secretion system tube protein TssD [Pseudomonas glycinae]
MPTPAFMTIHGSRQGLISAGAFTEPSVGNSYQNGREDKIMVQAFSHGILLPKGAGAGRRMHKPLVITKTIDKASPQPTRTPRIYRLVESMTGEPLPQQPYIATVDGIPTQRRTDAEGIAHLFMPDDARQISMRVFNV